MQAVLNLMNRPDPPTCILLPDDHSTLGALQAAKQLNLRVPEDLSLAGYDGIRLTQMLQPRLTTIEQDTKRIGAQAAEFLIDRIENPRTAGSETATIPVKLLEGESMGICPMKTRRRQQLIFSARGGGKNHPIVFPRQGSRWKYSGHNPPIKKEENPMKKLVALLLCLMMVVPAMLASAETAEGKVLNIWCWNDEFQSRFNAYYPEVKEIAEDKSTTTLNDGTIVKWTINPNEGNNYQNKLDEALRAQESAAADDKIDIFLIEADYALKYVDSPTRWT